MSESGDLCYKTSRKNAGLTQEEACYHLDIEDVRTLSKYENGKLKVNDLLLKRMTLLYRDKMLPLQHFKYLHPELAEFIPDPKELHGDGEHVLYFEFASDKLKAIKKKAKKYLSNDGKLDSEEIEKLMEEIPAIKSAINEATSFIGYIENQSLKMEDGQ